MKNPSPSLTLLQLHTSPCKALTWHQEDKRYLCGMVSKPSLFITWLPKRFDQTASKIFKRWIAADTLCDADVEMEMD